MFNQLVVVVVVVVAVKVLIFGCTEDGLTILRTIIII